MNCGRISGYVPQKGVLFSGDIASNIRYGREDAGVDEVNAAIKTAQAKEFVDGTEHGLETPIAQGGGNVSGGQKQRLAIARALVKKAPIYIFDDSFSALDFKTDAALRKALRGGHQGRYGPAGGPACVHHYERRADHCARRRQGSGDRHPPGTAEDLPRISGDCGEPAPEGGT